jgi:cysteine desulfurase
MYLDNAATTEVFPEVIEIITETMRKTWGNPSSMHNLGFEAKKKLDFYRKSIAEKFNCFPDEIIFTSGACESNSLALNGKTITTTSIEHKSVVGQIRLPVDHLGFVLLPKQKIETDTVSIQAANSEIGTIQDIESLSKIFKDKIFHTDATQYLPYYPIDCQKEWRNVDMFSMSGQKIHGPKGIGFLYCKRGTPLKPLIHGAQEQGRRGGTENLPYIAGLWKAIEMLDYNNEVLIRKRNLLLGGIKEFGLNFVVNGSIYHRLPNNLNVAFKGIDSRELLGVLNEFGIYCSTGSACNSGSKEISNVIQAIGLDKEYINGVLRFSLSTNTDVLKCIEILNKAFKFYLNTKY